MITSYTISPEMLFGQRIDQSIFYAYNRGAKIYIYYKNLSFCKESDLRKLEIISGYCQRFEQNDNHAKCIAVDETKVAIGSHNWLSERNQRTLNSSFVVTGTLVKGLIQDVWQGIRFYQNLKHDNQKGIASFYRDRDAFSTGAYEFSPGEFYYTLRTPEAHSILFEDEVIKKAKSRVVIFSPFIRLNKLREILSHSNLIQLEDRGVKTHLFTLPDPYRADREKTEIFNYLEQTKRGYFHFSYSTHYDLHAKTIIADDLICEGSFNLLSAVDSIDHSANNFEMSVAIRGKIAIPFIEAFYQSELGLKVFPIASFLAKRKETSVSVNQRALNRTGRLSFSSIGSSSAAASSGGMREGALSSISSLVFPKTLSLMGG